MSLARKIRDTLRLGRRWRILRLALRNLGVGGTLGYVLRSVVYEYLVCRPYRLYSPHALHPLWCRPATTDKRVYNHVFLEREYACLDYARDVRLVLDCGANVGYASAYLLTRFPTATVVAVEPDPGNFALLERNLAPFGERARCVRSGLWSRPCGLVMSEAVFRDGGAWARRVREARPGEPAEMTAMDVDSLLRASGFERISILKMDIEGAEAVVFSAPCDDWLSRMDTLAVELHDAEAERLFFRAIQDHSFEVSRYGELTVCKRRG